MKQGIEVTSHGSGHAISVKLYAVIFIVLLILTAVTVAASFVDLGKWNTAVALVIACSKAMLVILFFMHVKDSEKLIWIFASAGFYWLAILMVITMHDYFSREVIKGLWS